MTPALILTTLKLAVTVFFGVIFFGNLIPFFTDRVKPISADLYFQKQLWILISIVVIGLVWSVVP